MDVVGQWITQRCDVDAASMLATATAFADYSNWANEEVGWTLGKLTFRRHLSARGFAATKGTHGQRLIAGLRLKGAVRQPTEAAACRPNEDAGVPEPADEELDQLISNMTKKAPERRATH